MNHRVSKWSWCAMGLGAWLAVSGPVWAADAKSGQIGTLTAVEGAVQVFAYPSTKFDGPSPRVLFENSYYTFLDGKAGQRVDAGYIVRTAPDAKARIVYDNGDQFYLGGGSAYQVAWKTKSAVTETDIKLLYGRLRGVVAKGGPRSHMVIHTRSAVMGVRGTDFVIADPGAGPGPTEVAVLRGQVEVRTNGVKVAAQQIPAGQTAEVAPAAAEIETHASSQEELVGIRKFSTIQAVVQAVNDETSQKLEVLEKKAVESTLHDIRDYDPKLYAKLQAGGAQTVQDLNAQAIESLVREAPKAKPNRKPYKNELEDDRAGNYDKFYPKSE